MFRALDAGMSVAAFWQSSPRAVVTLTACARAARAPTARTVSPAPARAQPPRGERLRRIPR